MTPKEKAKELIEKFYSLIFDIDLGRIVSNDHKRLTAAKQCALIAVDEIIDYLTDGEMDSAYFQEVKQEIEKLS